MIRIRGMFVCVSMLSAYLKNVIHSTTRVPYHNSCSHRAMPPPFILSDSSTSYAEEAEEADASAAETAAVTADAMEK